MNIKISAKSLFFIILALSLLLLFIKDTTITIMDDTDLTSDDESDNGIFSAYEKKAKEKLSTLSLEEKIGQLILGRCPVDNPIGDIQKYNLGGYVLFGRDFENKTTDEVKSMINSYEAASKIPMLMAVDEEGGTVVRISRNPNLNPYKFKSPSELFLGGGFDSIACDTKVKAKLLQSLGINLNLAPVADVSINPSDYIHARTLGLPAQETSKFITTVITNMKGFNVSSCLKHFPGYGNNTNTHTGIAIDNRPLENFRNSDFLPFSAGIKSGCECILVSHNIVTAMDPKAPASLSPAVHKILRDELKFTGAIITDDLAMDAIKEYTNNEDPAVIAILADNDMIITTDFVQSYNAILQAVQSNKVSLDIINNHVLKILEWKYSLNLL